MDPDLVEVAAVAAKHDTTSVGTATNAAAPQDSSANHAKDTASVSAPASTAPTTNTEEEPMDDATVLLLAIDDTTADLLTSVEEDIAGDTQGEIIPLVSVEEFEDSVHGLSGSTSCLSREGNVLAELADAAAKYHDPTVDNAKDDPIRKYDPKKYPKMPSRDLLRKMLKHQGLAVETQQVAGKNVRVLRRRGLAMVKPRSLYFLAKKSLKMLHKSRERDGNLPSAETLARRIGDDLKNKQKIEVNAKTVLPLLFQGEPGTSESTTDEQPMDDALVSGSVAHNLQTEEQEHTNVQSQAMSQQVVEALQPYFEQQSAAVGDLSEAIHNLGTQSLQAVVHNMFSGTHCMTKSGGLCTFCAAGTICTIHYKMICRLMEKQCERCCKTKLCEKHQSELADFLKPQD
jgi:hypothetical protein